MLTVQKKKDARKLSNRRRRHRHFVGWPSAGCPIDNSRIDHNRWYDPSVGKWLSEDPSGLAAGANPYRYCDNGPTDATDPSGMDWTTWGAALLGHDLAGDAAAVQANLAAGNERAAAAAAVTVYGDIIWGTQFKFRTFFSSSFTRWCLGRLCVPGA